MAAVYVASALGHALPGRIFHRRTLVPALEANALTVLDPWADDDGRIAAVLAAPGGPGRAAYAELLPWLAARNAALLRRSAAVLAVLDGAAGPDAGVAAEVGLACGLGIAVVGWRSDLRAGGPGAGGLPAPIEHLVTTGGGSVHEVFGDAVAAVAALAKRGPS